MAGKVNEAYRFWFSVRNGNGSPRTGLLIGDMTITVRDPTNTNTMAVPTLVEFGGGLYYFDISAAFTLANLAGEYGILVEITTSPLDTASDIVEFFASDFDDLAVPGDAMDLVTDAVDAAAIATDAIDADALATSAVNEIRDSILSDSTPFDGADIPFIRAGVIAIEVDTQDIQTRLPAALIGGRMDSTVGAIQTAALTAMVNAILNEPMNTHVTAGTVGRYIAAAGGAQGLNVLLDGGSGNPQAVYADNNQLTEGRFRYFDTAINMDAATLGNAGLQTGEMFTVVIAAGDPSFANGLITAVPRTLINFKRRSS